MLLLVICLALLSSSARASLTQKQVNVMVQDLVDTFDLHPSYGDDCGDSCEYGATVAGFVRLAFHDAVGGGGPNGIGGANGCIDPKDPNNNGLPVTINALETVYQRYADQLSRADFWQLAANTATAFTSTQGETPLPKGMQPPPYTVELPFRYGRVDQANCDGLDIPYVPPVDISWAGLKLLWVDRIGMTTRGCVAIMGAHSLGRCVYANSGFNGAWTQTASSFSNVYYSSMMRVKWINNNASDVWINPETTDIMLTADVEPLFSPSASCPKFGGGLNGTKKCPFNPEGAPIFMQYAKNQTAFYDEYYKAFQVMVDYQYQNLQEPEADVERARPWLKQ